VAEEEEEEWRAAAEVEAVRHCPLAGADATWTTDWSARAAAWEGLPEEQEAVGMDVDAPEAAVEAAGEADGEGAVPVSFPRRH
jgi:hypothetical protein